MTKPALIRTSLALGTLLLALTVSTTDAQARGRFGWHHPRRAQVLGRDANLNRRINNNRGNLDGHYGQLKREDRGIRRQEQRDARQNGGYITRGEQNQINREENRVNRQIQRDK